MKRMYALLLLLISFCATAQSDTEPNNTFETANAINAKATGIGTINASSDQFDFYRTILPVDGTLKIYVEGTNTGIGTGYLRMYGYDRRQASGNIFSEFVQTTGAAQGSKVSDTFYVYGRAADTFYFRLDASQAFSYGFRYEMVDTSTNDAEPNGTFEQAVPIAEKQVKKGHTNYQFNGTSDQLDFYKTVLPIDGTLKIYVEGTNTSDAAGYLRMYGYDRRQASGNVFSEFVETTSAAKGSTVRDTFYLYGRAVDTFYFRLDASQAFSYSFRYEMADTSVNDVEPNGTFEQPVSITEKQVKKGHTNYQFNGTSDQFDFYKTVLPTDGTLKIYIEGINTSDAAGYLRMYGYDRRQVSGNIFSEFVQTTSAAKGSKVSDTFYVYSRAADTFYFRLDASQAFSYSFRYEMVDTSTNDIEPNGSFEEAVSIAEKQVKKGHSNYLFNGTSDQFDFYKTVLPIDGTLKIYIEGTNTSDAAGYLRMYGYDSRQASGNVFSEFVETTSAAKGSTVRDTFYLYGRAVDTFYFRLDASQAFNYSFRYEMVDTSTNDVEPNGGFEEAVTIAEKQVKKGHTNYQFNGTSDQFDFYKTLLPSDGTLLVYLRGTNTGEGAGYLRIYGYDKRKASGNIFSDFVQTTSAAKGTAVSDTFMIECSAQDSFYFRIDASQAFAYQLSYEVTLGKDTMVKVCPGYTTNILGLYNTVPFSTVKYETLAAAVVNPVSVGVGVYRVVVYNGKECTRDTAIITVAANPKPNLGADTTIRKCAGFAADIRLAKDTTGYALTEWSTPTPNAVDVGNYTLIVTNEFGCKDTANITVANYPQPVAAFAANTASQCLKGNNFSFTNTSTIAGGTVSYLWNFGDNTTSTSATPSKTYPTAGTFVIKLIVTSNNGCMDSIAKTVAVNPVPVLGADKSITISCLGGAADITALYNTAGYTSVAYSTTTPTAAPAGVYSLVVTNANGCKDTAAITVQPATTTVVATMGANSKSASRECTDAQGWTHYYSDNGTSADVSDDILLLSIKKNGNNIGTTGDGSFLLRTAATSGAGSNKGVAVTTPLITNTSGFWAFNRYWLVTPTKQPGSAVGVRFYYTSQDLNDVNGSNPSHTHQQLVFYKLVGGNPDPTTNLAGAQKIISLLNGQVADTSTWTYHQLNATAHYAEFTVNQFSGGGGGVTGNNMVLPLSLPNFKASSNNEGVLLQWSTSLEINTASFTIQRSFDGNTFQSVGNIPASGAGTAYSFTDHVAVSPGVDKIFYRLRITDKDGAVTYSPVLAVQPILHNKFSISPNPANNIAYIRGSNIRQVQLTDNIGRTISTEYVNNVSVHQLKLSGLSKGLYLVKITDKDGFTTTEKLMIR